MPPPLSGPGADRLGLSLRSGASVRAGASQRGSGTSGLGGCAPRGVPARPDAAEPPSPGQERRAAGSVRPRLPRARRPRAGSRAPCRPLPLPLPRGTWSGTGPQSPSAAARTAGPEPGLDALPRPPHPAPPLAEPLPRFFKENRTIARSHGETCGEESAVSQGVRGSQTLESASPAAPSLVCMVTSRAAVSSAPAPVR